MMTATRVEAVLRLEKTLKPEARTADLSGMGRGAIGLCATVGMFVGGYIPVMWGASSFGLTSLVFSAAGGVAGVWVGRRVTEY